MLKKTVSFIIEGVAVTIEGTEITHTYETSYPILLMKGVGATSHFMIMSPGMCCMAMKDAEGNQFIGITPIFELLFTKEEQQINIDFNNKLLSSQSLSEGFLADVDTIKKIDDIFREEGKILALMSLVRKTSELSINWLKNNFMPEGLIQHNQSKIDVEMAQRFGQDRPKLVN